MMSSEQAILDDLLIQHPPCSISRARKLWARLGGLSHFVLVKGKAAGATGGKLLLTGLEIIRRVILAIPWLVVCISMAMFVGSWYFAGPAVTVSSFMDASGDKSGSLGQMTADALALELQRIDQLDTVKNPWGRAEEVHSLLVTTPQAYERVGTISVGGTQLPIESSYRLSKASCRIGIHNVSSLEAFGARHLGMGRRSASLSGWKRMAGFSSTGAVRKPPPPMMRPCRGL
jgi:hypothetical protein